MFSKKLGRQFLLILTALLVLVTAKNGSAETITWINTAGGSWTDAMNWDLNRVPTTNDDVLITTDGTYTVLVDNGIQGGAKSVTIGAINGTQSLILTNSTDFRVQENFAIQPNGVCIVGSQVSYNQMVVDGQLFWLSGTLGGSTLVATNGNLNISGYDAKFLEGHTLVNRGTVNWISGPLYTQNSPGAFINESLVVFQNGGMGAASPASVSLFQNNGTLLCPSNWQATFFCNWNFTNSGTLTVLTNGVLTLSGGAGFGSLNFAEGTLLNGPGKTLLTDSALTASGTITVDGTFELAGQQQYSSGTLKGTQTWVGSGNFNWTGGNMAEAGTTTIGTNFNLNISGYDAKSIETHTLVNRGTVNWTSGSLYTQNNPGAFINESLINFQNGSLGAASPASVSLFQNNGTLLCPTNWQATFFCNWNFTNSGTLTVQTNGVLTLSGGGGGFGSLNFAEGTLLNGPGKTLLTDSALTASGTITVDGTFELAGQQFYGSGTLKGTQTWTGAGNFNWTGGSMAGPGVTTVGTNFNLNISGFDQKSIDGHTLANRGTVNWLSGSVSSANNAGSFVNDHLLIIQTQGASLNGTVNASTFQNNGTMIFPPNQGPVVFFYNNWNLTNSGTLTVQTNTLLDFMQNGSGSLNFADGTLINGSGRARVAFSELIASGTITVDGTFDLTSEGSYAGILKGTQTWTGSGNFNWNGGSMTAPGITTIADNFHLNIQGFDQKKLINHTLYNRGTVTFYTSLPLQGNTNAVINNAGSFVLTNYCTFASVDGTAGFNNLAGGTICTPGTNAPSSQTECTMNWTFNNAGVLALNSGTFNVTPAYSPAASSTHRFSLASNNSGLLKLADFTPAGTLDVTLKNGVVVTNGSAFQLITYTSHTGTFSSKHLPMLPAPLSWELDYQPTALFLKVVSVPLELKSIQKLADGSFKISASGATGSDYIIEASTNLVDWTVLLTNTAANGSVDFIDSSATNFNKQFYRLKLGN